MASLAGIPADISPDSQRNFTDLLHVAYTGIFMILWAMGIGTCLASVDPLWYLCERKAGELRASHDSQVTTPLSDLAYA